MRFFSYILIWIKYVILYRSEIHIYFDEVVCHFYKIVLQLSLKVFTNWEVTCEQFFFTTFGTAFCSVFSLVKNNRERKRKRENKIIMWIWERKLYKIYIKIIVQISFLLLVCKIWLIWYAKRKFYMQTN